MVRDDEVSREEWSRQSIGMLGKGELDRERTRLVVEGKDREFDALWECLLPEPVDGWL